MKIDRTKVKKGTSEVPDDCAKIINYLKLCSEEELLKTLEQINVWYYGKCELYHWIDVLDRFDQILSEVAKSVDDRKWIFQFDVLDEQDQVTGRLRKHLIFHILKFTALLIEHSYARHLYNSVEHLIALLDCIDGNIILSVLNLIFVFSKRSNYLSRLPGDKKKLLQEKLVDLAQTWGGLEAGCALEQCCSEDTPVGAGSVYYEYYATDETQSDNNKKVSAKSSSNRYCIDLKNIHQMASNAGVIMENLVKTRKLPENIQSAFYHRLRLAYAMANYEQRLQYVQARLQALSILVYSNAASYINLLVYDGLIEEIVNTLKIKDETFRIAEVKSSCLKTLTAIIHLDRNPRLQSTIDCTEATSYHGFLPSLVRKCILHMTDTEYQPFPQQLATSLFSFLYHLASYESGCEALVASGLIESLLKVVLWPGQDDHITFVTRAVRVIDLITNLDMGAFQTHNGLTAFVSRLEREVKLCSEFHGPALSAVLPCDQSPEEYYEQPDKSTATGETSEDVEMKDLFMGEKPLSSQRQCLPQRAALLKSILNFLKKIIPDPAFADYTRSLMDENLQYSLKLIISNAEYYGALLFLLATDVITVFIFHEPSLLSCLQDSGLTWVVLKALIVKDVPATRENLASLPNTLSALCLNARGLEAFIKCKPFERLFQILISPEYLPAMKRKRSSDPQGDTAMHLGSAMDELMRHQPTLKRDAMKAIIKLLEELCSMGRDPSIIAFHPADKTKLGKVMSKADSTNNLSMSANNARSNEDPLSDDEMEEEYRSVLIRKADRKNQLNESEVEASTSTLRILNKRKYVPVVDYLLNVTKFLDNILSNNGTDDHCVEFVRLGGLEPLYNLLNMANFPLEFPLMPACQSIAQVCKSIAMLSQDTKVFKEGMKQLDELADYVESLYSQSTSKGSVLLSELASTSNPLEALYEKEVTPLVHAMSAAHAYVNVFVFICRGAQTDIRSMSIAQWGSDLGKKLIKKLGNLYTKLVWESSTLLTLCTPATDEDLSFCDSDMEKLVTNSENSKEESGANDAKSNQLTLLKWLLTSSSHLGRALAELFGLLVLQSVGTQTTRLRRHPNNINQNARPCVPAQRTASMLTKLLVDGLNWKCPDEIPVSRLRLTFYICCVGFSSPILFDSSKNPYHLMLQQFENAGGIEALFQRFNWIVEEYLSNKSKEEVKAVVGINDFLDGWLDLISHMVNTKNVFESTHTLPTTSTLPDFIAFDATQYLARIHKHAFEAVTLLWKYDVIINSENSTIAERILTILCHIIKGEKQLHEKFILQNKQKERQDKTMTTAGLLSAIQKTPAPTSFRLQPDIPEINAAYIQLFVDMGFTEAHARDALIQTENNFEAATEYLLTIPAPLNQPSSSSAGNTTQAAPRAAAASDTVESAQASSAEPPPVSNMDVDVSEEDMMFQAIAMSLRQGAPRDAAKKSKKEVAATNNDKTMETNTEEEGSIPDITIDDLEQFKTIINQYTNEMLDKSLQLLDKVPSTVHTVCDLLIGVSLRNGPKWRNCTLQEIVNQIQFSINRIITKLDQTNDVKESLEILSESESSSQLAVRLHLYLLMFQDIENICAYILQESDCPKLLIELLSRITSILKRAKGLSEDIQTPKMVAPLILIFDHYEKAALIYKRRKDQNCSHTWKWFDDRSGRWCNYSVSNNTSIDTAYHAGETTVKFTAGRRRYMVFFKTLVQINEDTSNRRPIMLDVLQDKPAQDDLSKHTKGNVESAKESELRKNSTEKSGVAKSIKRKHETSEKQKMDVDKKQDEELVLSEVNGLPSDVLEQLVYQSTDLLSIPVNSHCLNAILRVILRVTRDFSMACYFAQRNGVENLLKLKEHSSFSGALPLVTLILRHIVEDAKTLEHTVQRAIATSSNNGFPNMFCGVGQNSLGAKELHYLLRALGPIACRNENLYQESITKLLRINLPNSRRGQLEETIPPNSPQIIKVPQEHKSISLDGNIDSHMVMENFIHTLLSSLVDRYIQELNDRSSNQSNDKNEKTKTEKKKSSVSKTATLHSTLVRRLTGEHIDEDEMANATNSNGVPGETKASSTTETDTSPKSNKPFLSLTVLIRLLTELAKSYAAVTKLVVMYTYHGDSCAAAKNINIEGSILAFIFDHLLPHPNKDSTTENDAAKESKPSTIATLTRSLLSVIGAYWQNTEIQNIFVTELKSALARALQLSESKAKHLRLQAIFNLITTMIESAAPISFTSSPPLQNTSFIKMLIKRGLIADLSRTTHNLDLSSKDLVNTVNIMLKPLEKLTNLANSQNVQTNKQNKNESEVNGQGGTASHASADDGRNATNTNEDVIDSLDVNDTDVTRTLEPTTRDLEDIVEVMLGEVDDDGPDILAETMITQEGNLGNGIEPRIYIEANIQQSDSSDSDNSSDSEDGRNEANRDDPLNELEVGPEDNMMEGLVDLDDNALNVNTSMMSQETTDVDTSQNDTQPSTVNVDSDGHLTSFIETGDDDDDDDPVEDDVLGDGDDDDSGTGDDEDDDVNDDEDDEGSEMDADDTIAGADDAIIFGENDDDDDVNEDLGDPFAEFDGNNDTLEITFPRRPFTVRIPHGPSDNTNNSTAQSRAAILNHPLLLRSNDQTTRSSTNQRNTRNRTYRSDRSIIRTQGNTVHIHSNANTFARVLIGDSLQAQDYDLSQGNDDVFFDIFGDSSDTSSGLLNSVPSALSRWTVESRLLDGASVHDCVNKLKPSIVAQLEKLQQEELKKKISEEKKKKEEAEKKKENAKETKTVATEASQETSSTEPLQTTTSSSTSANTISTSAETGVVSSTSDVDAMEFSPTETISTEPVASIEGTNQQSNSSVIPESATSSSESLPTIPTTSSRETPANRSSQSVVTTLWRPASFEQQAPSSSFTPAVHMQDTPSRFITPMNPLPEIEPNAPQRDPRQNVVSTTSEPTAIPSVNQSQLRSQASDIASILGLPPNTELATQTPIDIPRLNQFRNNIAALTGDLGFTPNSQTDTDAPQSEYPSVARILATPSDIPSLQQIRNSSLFSRDITPRMPPNFPNPLRSNVNTPNVPSPLSRLNEIITSDASNSSSDSSFSTTQPVSSGTSTLAADLAAAIMSQLVTSSPTPFTSVNTTTVDVSSNVTSLSTTPQVTTSIVTSSSSVTTSLDVVSSTVTVTTNVATTTIVDSTSGSGASAAGNEVATESNEAARSDGAAAAASAGPASVSTSVVGSENIQRQLEDFGVDPSFLAALPENIREEVLREQFGIGLQAAARGSTGPSSSNQETVEEPQEVSPEFLAALPPEVQQEVLEQQRMEQARYQASQQRPEDVVDPAEFVRNLNPSLRRQVLADMDDTVLAVLPPELSSEAQGLRREVEQRQLQRQRSTFSQMIQRHQDMANRYGSSGFQLARIFPRGQMNSWKVTDGNANMGVGAKKVGRQLLDPESLTCILVLLFLNDNTLNAARLHRILRNLSYHNPTKQWLIYALISILRRTSSYQQEQTATHKPSSVLSDPRLLKDNREIICEELSPNNESEMNDLSHTHWLSRTLNLAFGGCINIFQLQKVGKKASDSFVSVHQQACLDVCKQTLEALSFLAKNFPTSFAPIAENEKKNEAKDEAPGPSRFTLEDDNQSEFWDILVRLNVSGSGLKGKAMLKNLRDFPKVKASSVFVTSPLGQILSMLSHPVVKQSAMLTDKLLRLLAVISMSLPEKPRYLQAQPVDVVHESSPDARPPDDEVLPQIPHQMHTVTFADTDDVLPRPEQIMSDDDTDANRTEASGTACSETTSVTSSLLVEAPEINNDSILLPPVIRQHPTITGTGSVLSGFSDGTVAQSDISGITEHIRAEHDSMDVDHQSHAISDTSSTDNRSSPALSLVHLPTTDKEPSILIGQLRMAVNVLASGTCSDEGLEDATTLLLQLSRTEPVTRDSILDLLLEAAQETANTLRDEIQSLWFELKQYNAKNSSNKTGESSKSSKSSLPIMVNPASARSQPWRGRGGRTVRRGTFGGNQSRRNVPKPVIFDLHLPTMAALTTKRSSQSLFLRLLKVVLQLRDAAKKSATKPTSSSNRANQPRSRGIQLIQRLHHGGGSLHEVVAALEADMEAMYEMIDRYGGGGSSNTADNSGAASSNNTNDANSQRQQSATDNARASTSSNNEGDDSSKPEEPIPIPQFPKLSSQLNLDDLWDILGKALTELADTSDANAVLVLQPAVEAFFLVHGSEKDEEKKKENEGGEPSSSSISLDVPPSPNPPSPGALLSPIATKFSSQSSFILKLPPDTQKFLRFAETHRTVLNQILRQSNNPLSDGPFAVLVNHTRLLDFDVKRRYFRQELEKQDKGHRREDMAVHIRREHVFEDSYRELHRRTPEEIKNRLYVVFDGEEGQDAGGLLREWYGIMAREMFNPNYALFTISQGEKSTYLPNRNSHCNPNHLSYFKFAGRIVAKAIYDNKLIDSYFTRSFYKHILGKSVHYTDMEAEDYGFYQGLVYLLEHDISDLGYEITFSAEVPVFGMNEVHDLKPNGRNIPVTEETKREYVKLVCQEKMTGSIRQQIDSFLEGFYEIIPKRLISIFDEQELELLIAGLPTIDIDDLRTNTEYHKYTENSLQIQWFWRALRSFEQADRAKFLQFVTGTSRVPLQGFATLEGMNGVQKFQIHRDDRSTDRLPCAHTCFNQLDLPAYETYDKLHAQLLKAIQECPEGFGLA